jgi:hypothetical protein
LRSKTHTRISCVNQLPDMTEKTLTDLEIDKVLENVKKSVPAEGLSDAFVTSLSIILVSEVIMTL